MLAYQMPTLSTAQSTPNLASDPDTNAEMGSPQPSTTRKEPNEVYAQARIKNKKTGETEGIKLTLRPGYQYRQANWEIGRAAERSKEAQKVKPFRPGDRFAAWRKANERKARNAERRAMGRGGKKK